MTVRYEMRPLGKWVGEGTASYRRRRSPFRADFQSTVQLLSEEVEQLRGRLIVIQVDVREGEIRKDGTLSARARVGSPGVRVAFDSKHGPLTYATDRYTTWHGNLRAIALSLQALRAVDRYGVSSRGEQYRGWSAIEARPAHSFATLDAACAFLGEHAGWVKPPDSADPFVVKLAYREAAKKLHPDHGGDSSLMARLNEAYRMLGGGQ